MKQNIAYKYDQYYKTIRISAYNEKARPITAALLVIADILEEIGFTMPKEKEQNNG